MRTHLRQGKQGDLFLQEARWTRFQNSKAGLRRKRPNILRGDGIELCEKIIDEGGIAIYADPPYVVGDEYLHGFTEDDHVRLATALRRFRKTRVVVSYYDCPLVRELYAGWTIREIPLSKNMGYKMRGGPNDEIAPEILIINGPSLAGGGLFSQE